MLIINKLRRFASENAPELVARVFRLGTDITDICSKTKIRTKQEKIANFIS